MNYKEALEYLDSLNKFGIRLGLARIQRLLELMGNPERSYKTIHVTGTNGKGSTTAMLASILHHAGIRAGMYISPHLMDYTERITVAETAITQAAFADAVHTTKKFVDQLLDEGGESPTQFEVLTAAAFHYFAAAGVEYAVIEVGLGGLLDSTNVIIPEIAVITNVALEHAERCGGTLTAVAEHKAGIIKRAVPVVTAASEEVLPIIQAKAELEHAPLYVLGRDFECRSDGMKEYQQLIAFKTENYGQLGPLYLNLLGQHQVENSAVVIMATLLLAQKDERITGQAIEKGLSQVLWPGRFEIVEGQPLTIIDGAHNPAGAKVLRNNLDVIFPDRPIVFLLGILEAPPPIFYLPWAL
ncbi:bifunctional folylpolyglutamate synthase/dihydrofolate synthase [bacterium BFN5]|nr:bifunctional folylpolyglutamate synthase/dihydrofolate synthase [bacterium BFN5]